MKRTLCTVLILLMLLPLAFSAGCGRSTDSFTVFEGTASCERAERIKVNFNYYPAERYASAVEMDMNIKKVKYIEGGRLSRGKLRYAALQQLRPHSRG